MAEVKGSDDNIRQFLITTPEQKMLAALLRIEQILLAHWEPVEAHVEGELADRITNVVPQDTPLMKRFKGKGKK